MNNTIWYPITKIVERLEKRKWWWSAAAWHLKYINIRVDTRDNCCIVTVEDRDGEVVAKNIDEFNSLMDHLDKKMEGKNLTFDKMRDLDE